MSHPSQRPQDVESQYKNISGERDLSSPDWEESDLSFQDNDYELSQAQKVYGSLFKSSELVELRQAFLKSVHEDTRTVSLSELESIFVSLRFMDADSVYKTKQVRRFFTILENQCRVVVFIHKARDLISADWNGLSDPFCKVLVDGKETGQTSVQENTLNPVWEEHLPPFHVPSDSKTITIAVYDADFLMGQIVKKDYIGSVDIDMASVVQNEESWYQLKCDPKLSLLNNTFTVTGEVQVTLEIQGSIKEKKDSCGNIHASASSWSQVAKRRDLFAQDNADLTAIRVSFQDAVRILHYARDEGSRPVVPEVPNFPFDPDSWLKQSWDFLVMLLLLYTCFAVPVLLAFGGSLDPNAPLSAYDIWDLVLDCIFCLDILLSFCTCYVAQGVYIKDLRQISKHYLMTWFAIDVPGSIPFDKIIVYANSDSDAGSTLKSLKFIRMLKMVRAVRFLRMLDDLEERDQTGSLRTFFKIFRSIFMMLISAHFLGCMFIMLREALLDTRGNDNWMDAYDTDLHDADVVEQYVACLYWAIATVSTIGYGDVGPVNHEERMYTIFVAISGVIIFAFAMGNVTNCLQNTVGARSRFDDRLRQVGEYLHYREVKPMLKRRIMAHFGGAWKKSGDLFKESVLVSFLPPNAKKLLFEHLSIRAQQEVPLLKGYGSDFIGEIYINLEPMHFQKAEHIYSGEAPGGAMYFVTSGYVFVAGYEGVSLADNLQLSSVYRPQDLMKTKKVLADSVENFFGHIALFHEICELRPDVAEAKSHVETLCLTRAVLDKVRGLCPTFYSSLFDFCLLTASRYGVSNGKCVFRPLHTRSRTYPKIDQLCVELREQLMSQHKQFMMKDIFGLKEECAEASSPIRTVAGDMCSAGPYIGTDVIEESISPQRKESTAGSPYSKIVECQLLVCSLGMFRQKLPSPDEWPTWKRGYLCVAKNLDVWYIIDKMDNLIESTPMCMGTLVINQQDFQKTCQIWKFDKDERQSQPIDKVIERCGIVKKRGRFNTSYKERFFVLTTDVLYYYDDIQVYLANMSERLGTKIKVSLSTRHLKVSPGTPTGVDNSSDGYHFTIESTFDSKVFECSCIDREGRDMWVRKIREASKVQQQVFHRTEGKNKGKGLHEQQHQQDAKYGCGCVIKVSDGPKGAIKRIYVGCPSKKAATDTRTSILEAAACISQNLKTISKATSLDCVIFPMDPESKRWIQTSNGAQSPPPHSLSKEEVNGNSYNNYEKGLANLQAETSSHVQLQSAVKSVVTGEDWVASIGAPTRKNGYSEHVFQKLESLRSFDLHPHNTYHADDNDSRVDHMVQTLDAKIERTHEMLLQQAGKLNSLGSLHEVIMKKLDVIMEKLMVDSIGVERRPS